MGHPGSVHSMFLKLAHNYGKQHCREKKAYTHKKIKDGGLKIVSVKEFIMSLKLIWMKKS